MSNFLLFIINKRKFISLKVFNVYNSTLKGFVVKKREIEVYNELFVKRYSKKQLEDKFEVSTKTIENTTKLHDDIVYSKKLGNYGFKNLLPKYISYYNYFVLFQDNFSNPILKKDFIKITNQLNENLDEIMIDTSKLSSLSQKVIQLNIAINHNCVVKVNYQSYGKAKEEKYIQANQIVVVGSIYYLYVTYDKRNKKNIGEPRQFALNGIQEIEFVEYLTDISFKTNVQGNGFGNYNNTSSISLKLKGDSAHFFMREGLFETPNYKFLSEEDNGDINMELFYNNKIEVIKLVQQWMPFIEIDDSYEEAQSIINDIKKNYSKLMESI